MLFLLNLLKQEMRILLVSFIFFVYGTLNAQQILQQDEFQTKAQLASAYFNSSDFEKAAPLMLDIYRLTKNSYYFDRYIDCLAEQQKLEDAETAIRNEYGKSPGIRPELLVHWGYILKLQKREAEAKAKYDEALKLAQPSKGYYVMLGNAFINRREFEMAEKTYLKAKTVIPGDNFNFELGLVYLYQRNFTRMMDEFLNVLRTDETQLPMVQSYLSSALQIDVDNEGKELFRGLILKRIQAEPSVIAYNRLLIWFFLQEKKFSQALRQSIAIDKRTGTEDNQIMGLGYLAVSNGQYTDGQSAFGYIAGKGENNPFYWSAFLQNLNCSFLKFTKSTPINLNEGRLLPDQYEKALAQLGYGSPMINAIIEYSQLLAFYLDNSEKAISVLQKVIDQARMPIELIGQLKTALADIYLYNNDPFEATLIYSQVIDANKNNALGDEVKLKKAKLGYYIGNFTWAKAQLDVIKASTSKLTANDAMELSLLIGNNLNLDTTAVPLQMFARGDYYFFRKKDSMAIAIYDSISDIYPYHSLTDDIYFRKAKIAMEKDNYTLAAEYLVKLVEGFSYESLADDALYMLADIYNNRLGQKEKAKELYSRLVLNYPGSIFVEESRQKFRDLREIYPDKKDEPVKIIESEQNRFENKKSDD
jgi:tetratricopeptide (TPR) repeat protein